MLYGMDEEEYVQDEYSLIKKDKLNIKKVIIVAIIMIICFLLIFSGFYLSSNTQKESNDLAIIEESKNKDNNIENVEQIINNNIDKNELANEKNNNENQTENINKDSLGHYIGRHIKIATHDMDKIKKKFVPQANLDGQQQIKDIYFSEEKQVYLTFDDGPSKDITPQVLDILKQEDVKATFFVLGARVDLYPETLRRIFDEGHYIANHGYSHKYSQIYQSKDTVFQEYVECENSIRAALNNEDYNSYLFRFPGGSTGGRYSKVKATAREWLNSYAIAYTNWNCLTGDAEGKTTKEECISEFIKTKSDQNSLIVLMHDANDKQQTVDSLPEIIQYLKNEGYTFKTFYEIF